MSEPIRCTRCVLAPFEPDIRLDAGGRCSLCQRDGEPATDPDRSRPLLESDFVRLIDKFRGRGEYDCLVMVSGGRDSIAALHFMVRRFRMRPLAFTFDNGFGSPQMVDNARGVAEALGVDWMVLRSTWMWEFFAEIIRNKAPVPICPPCSLWYMNLCYELAEKYGIRLIITGWTKGQISGGQRDRRQLASSQDFPTLSRATADFIRDLRKRVPKYRDFPLTMDEVRRRHRKALVLSPHWYLPYEAAEYEGMIRDEFGWRPIPLSYPAGSTNCGLNFVSAWLSNQHFGFNHHHIEMSQLIRMGELSREEALQALHVDIRREPVAALVDDLLARLGCSRADLEVR